ncbi:MAG: hypothetical protein DMF12_09355 [Verrucomicrobia bacterium]|nr:MAG: hypothetical protein DMF12_09355 [Verrucomicrobiota bacterium]
MRRAFIASLNERRRIRYHRDWYTRCGTGGCDVAKPDARRAELCCGVCRYRGVLHGFNWGGAIVALAVFGGLTWAILKTQSLAMLAPHMATLTVKRIGTALMTTYVWPLQCVGLLLTAALIGALILVLEEKR